MKTSVVSSWRSRSPEPRRSPLSSTRRASLRVSDDVGLERALAEPSRAAATRAASALEADQLRVAAGARREALRADVQRLEEVRLAGAVRAVEEDDARLESELERGIRAEVAERDVADDQPASRMGMIRYQKLSSGRRDEAGAQAIDELELHGVAGDRLEAVAQEVRVEADLELLAGVLDRERLGRLADVLGLRGDR